MNVIPQHASVACPSVSMLMWLKSVFYIQSPSSLWQIKQNLLVLPPAMLENSWFLQCWPFIYLSSLISRLKKPNSFSLCSWIMAKCSALPVRIFKGGQWLAIMDLPILQWWWVLMGISPRMPHLTMLADTPQTGKFTNEARFSSSPVATHRHAGDRCLESRPEEQAWTKLTGILEGLECACGHRLDGACLGPSLQRSVTAVVWTSPLGCVLIIIYITDTGKWQERG